MKGLILIIVVVLGLLFSISNQPPTIQIKLQSEVETSQDWDYENAEVQDFDAQFEARIFKNGGLRK